MTTANQMATALLTEHFRYTPLTLLDDIINTVNELVHRAINGIEEGLNNATPETLGFKLDSNASTSSLESRREAMHAAKQTEIDSGIVQLETLLNATVDKDFDKFEIYTLRNILSVGHEEEELAGWVQLEHYKNLDLSHAKDAPTPEQVQLQRRKLHETSKLNAMLKAEEARNAAVLAELQTMLGVNSGTTSADSQSPFAFLAKAAPAQGASRTANNAPIAGQPLQQNVQYALGQLPQLRQLLAQLKGTLQTLPNARHNPDEEARERYIDTQARRALQRRAIDPENPATVAAASGRRIGRDEVEGIEAVVGALETMKE